MNKDVNSNYLPAQELHDKMQTAHDCIIAAHDIKNCIPQMIIFTQEIFTHPFFTEDVQKELKKLEIDFSQILELKKKILVELNSVKNMIISHKAEILDLSEYIKKFAIAERKCSPNSFDLMIELGSIINHLCLFLSRIVNEKNFFDHQRAQMARKFLKKLVLLDENEKIIKYIYSPSLAQLDVEDMSLERLKKTKLWYFLHKLHHLYILYDLKKYSGQLSFFYDNNQLAAAFFLKDDFLKLELALVDNNKEEFIELNEYKIYIKHVWTFFKSKLLNHKELTYSYSDDANDLREGLLKKGIEEHKFVGESAKVLFVALKHVNITKNELEEKTKLSKIQVDNAIGVIQKAARKKLKIPKYISSNKGIVSVNNHTILIKNRPSG